jgi:hypothetical protein
MLSPSRSPLHAPLLALLAALSSARAASAGGPRSPEELADRWVECFRKGGEGRVKSLFKDRATIVLESAGKVRQLDPEHYAGFLASALSGLKGFERQRGVVEVSGGDEGKPRTVSFTTTDRIETEDGYLLESVNQEEFELRPADGGLAAAYRSRSVSCEALRKPEPWMNYGGPMGLNGHLLDAHFRSAPDGFGFVLVGAGVALIVFLKAIHSLGLGRRRA